MNIRWMIRRDMPEVLEIEQLCFPNPWTADDFVRVLRRKDCVGIVLEVGGDICGYVVYSLDEDSIDILNIAVHPSCWRRRLGSWMVDRLKTRLSANLALLSAVVSERNVTAQMFFRAHGLRHACTMRQPWCCEDDGYLMVYEIGSPVNVRIAE